MFKKLIALQLFADEPTTDNGTPTTEPAAAEPEKEIDTKKPVTAAEPKKDEPKYTDADLDRIINKKFAEMQQKKDKEVAEAAKLAEMNATQKAEYERDQLKKELEELKRKDTLAEMTKTARKMLTEDGINAPDELLAVLVTTDAEETKSTVDGFKTLFKDAVESAVKERLRGETPKVGTSNPAAAISEIDKRIKKYD